MIYVLIAATAFATWIHLLCGRGRFWLCWQSDRGLPLVFPRWPNVTTVISAREADCVADNLGSLSRRDCPGKFSIALVDEDSDDGTAAVARSAAADRGAFVALAYVIYMRESAYRGWRERGGTWKGRVHANASHS